MSDILLDGQPYVFISYASADRERVLSIVDALRDAGIACWLDQHDIAGGTNWGGSIAEAIEGCMAIILMSSAASLNSRNVRQEIALAWQHEKPYIPLLLDNTAIPNDVAYWLATAQWIDVLDHPVEVWLPKVVHALSGIRDQKQDTHRSAADDLAAQPQQTISLPSPPSSFVGRKREVAEVAALLHTERIVTLVGPGGIGKTRVAIAVGHRLTDEYRDGVVFVDLAPLRDLSLVLPTIAASIGLRESGDVSLFDALVTALRPRHLLLILDNVEQVIEAAASISLLVNACPVLAVLATSREPLRIGGEVEYLITPLSLPDSIRDGAFERLRSNPTVALFTQRARSSAPDFDLTSQNAEVISAICQRLDGIPLAIELAAVRIRVLSPDALLERLEDRLGFLTGGRRDLPDRQRTIRHAIQWSYDLLPPAEQCLFQRLSVFVGGWTLERAEIVVNNDGDLGIAVLDGVLSLAEKSLIIPSQQSDREARFSMLAMIREFAAEHLDASGETTSVWERHAHALGQLIDRGAHVLGTTGERAWLAELHTEYANIRAVLGWCLDTHVEHPERATTGLRLATGMWDYWDIYSVLGEGRRWLDSYLALPTAFPMDALVMAHTQAGYLALSMGDLDGAQRHLGRAVALADDLGQPGLAALAMTHQVRLYSLQGEHERAEAIGQRSLELHRAAGDTFGTGMVLGVLWLSAMERGDDDETQARVADTIEFTRRSGDRLTLANALNGSGWLAFRRGDLASARAMAHECATVSQQEQYWRYYGSSLILLGRIALDDGDRQQAHDLVVSGLRHLRRTDAHMFIVNLLLPTATVAVAAGYPRLAAQLLAARHRHWHLAFANLGESNVVALDATLQELLGEEYDNVTHASQGMTLDEAVAAAIAAFTSSTPAT